jgi:hypothetical protein
MLYFTVDMSANVATATATSSHLTNYTTNNDNGQPTTTTADQQR